MVRACSREYCGELVWGGGGEAGAELAPNGHAGMGHLQEVSTAPILAHSLDTSRGVAEIDPFGMNFPIDPLRVRTTGSDEGAFIRTRLRNDFASAKQATVKDPSAQVSARSITSLHRSVRFGLPRAQRRNKNSRCHRLLESDQPRAPRRVAPRHA